MTLELDLTILDEADSGLEIDALRSLSLTVNSYIRNSRNKDKSLRLSFRSKGEDVYVGDFLNEDDKNLLRDTISEIIEDLNSLSNLSN